jgi:CRISPR-associated protein Csx17
VKTPARYQAVLRQIDGAVYSFANRSEQGNEAKYLLEVLCALGRAEQTLAGGLAFCNHKYIRPLQGLSRQWLDQADDNSPEFRLAASLAGIRPNGAVGPLRVLLEEVEVTGFVNWFPGSASAVWSQRPLAANLAALFLRRLMEAFREPKTWKRAGVSLYSPRPARLSDVTAFLHDRIDEDRLAALIWGLSAIDWSSVYFRLPEPDDAAVPFGYGVPRLLLEPRLIAAIRDRWALTRGDEPNAQPDPNIFQILASGQSNAVEQCVDRAARRLKSAGLLVHGYRNRRLAGRSLAVESSIPAGRLLAAMLFPLSERDLEKVANAVLYPPESEE